MLLVAEIGPKGVMKDDTNLEVVVEQCTEQTASVRVSAYRTLIKKCTVAGEFKFSWSNYSSEDDTKKTIANIRTDLTSDAEDISYEAAGACGCLLANESFLSMIQTTDQEEVIDHLLNVIKEKKGKKVMVRLLWCIARSKLSHDIYERKCAPIIEVACDILKSETSPAAALEALQVIHMLLQVIPKSAAKEAKTWFPVAFKFLFHEALRVRHAAFISIQVMRTILEDTPDLAEIKTFVVSSVGMDLQSRSCKKMLDLVSKDNVDILKSWRLIVQVLGKLLHMGTSLINDLLEVVEKAFKSANPEIRIEAFRCWRTLINNFALDANVLMHHKRLKLLLAPLKANNTKVEEIAHEKLIVWWHLVCCLKKNAAVHFDLVVAPLLKFCFSGTSTGTSSGGGGGGLAQRNLMMSMGSTSPGRRFPGLHTLCAEVLAQLLSVGINIPGRQNFMFSLSSLEEPIIDKMLFIRIHQLLFTCASETLHSLNDNSDSKRRFRQNALGVLIIQSIIARTRALIPDDVSKKDAVEQVKDMFMLFSELEQQCKSGDMLSEYVFKFYELILNGQGLSLPLTAINSRHYNIATGSVMQDMMSGTLSNHLVQQLCKPTMVQCASQKEEYFTMWIAILENSRPSTGKLGFLQSVLKELDSTAAFFKSKHSSTLRRMWAVVVRQLLLHIDQTQVIDQGDGMEHDWSCVYSVLMFPINHSVQFPGNAVTDSNQQIMVDWSELWLKFIELTPLAVTAEPNSEVEFISKGMATLHKKLVMSSTPDAHAGLYNLMANVLLLLTQKMRYSELGKTSIRLINSPAKPKKKPHPLYNLASCVELFELLFTGVLRMGGCPGRLNTAQILLEAAMCIFRGIHKEKLVNALIPEVAGPLVEGFKVNPFIRFNSDIGKLFVKTLRSFSLMFEEQVGKSHTADHLQKLEPLFHVTLTSGSKEVKQAGRQLWKASFASTKHNLSESLYDVLKDCSLPPASLNDTQDDLDEIHADPKENVPDNIPGSFLKRTLGGDGILKFDSPKSKFDSPKSKFDSPKVTRLSLGTPKSKDKKSLHEMRDEDFVKVSSPKSSRRVLTEHQIEKMKERKEIPALYSDLSQSCSQMILPAQFASQHSFEESFSSDKSEASTKKRLALSEKGKSNLKDLDETSISDLSFTGIFSLEKKEKSDLTESSKNQVSLTKGKLGEAKNIELSQESESETNSDCGKVVPQAASTSKTKKIKPEIVALDDSVVDITPSKSDMDAPDIKLTRNKSSKEKSQMKDLAKDQLLDSPKNLTSSTKKKRMASTKDQSTEESKVLDKVDVGNISEEPAIVGKQPVSKTGKESKMPSKDDAGNISEEPTIVGKQPVLKTGKGTKTPSRSSSRRSMKTEEITAFEKANVAVDSETNADKDQAKSTPRSLRNPSSAAVDSETNADKDQAKSTPRSLRNPSSAAVDSETNADKDQAKSTPRSLRNPSSAAVDSETNADKDQAKSTPRSLRNPSSAAVDSETNADKDQAKSTPRSLRNSSSDKSSNIKTTGRTRRSISAKAEHHDNSLIEIEIKPFKRKKKTLQTDAVKSNEQKEPETSKEEKDGKGSHTASDEVMNSNDSEVSEVSAQSLETKDSRDSEDHHAKEPVSDKTVDDQKVTTEPLDATTEEGMFKNIKTYSGKKKGFSNQQKYSNNSNDYTDEELDEELRKTSIVLQNSLDDALGDEVVEDNQKVSLEHKRRKSMTPAKKSINDVRKVLKGKTLIKSPSESHINVEKQITPDNKQGGSTVKQSSKRVMTLSESKVSKIETPQRHLRRRIPFKQVEVSPSVVRDSKLKQCPAIELTEVDNIDATCDENVNDIDSDEAIPSSQEDDEPLAQMAHKIFTSRQGCSIDADEDKSANIEIDGEKDSNNVLKRKRDTEEEQDLEQKLGKKRKKTQDTENSQESIDNDSVLLLEETVDTEHNKLASEKKNDANKSRTLGRKGSNSSQSTPSNSQNSSDLFESQVTISPKVTRSGRRIVAPKKDMPEPMTPPGSTVKKKKSIDVTPGLEESVADKMSPSLLASAPMSSSESEENLVSSSEEHISSTAKKSHKKSAVKCVGEDVPKVVELESVVKRNVQKKITDMFSKEVKEISEGATLPEMEDGMLEFENDTNDKCTTDGVSESIPSKEHTYIAEQVNTPLKDFVIGSPREDGDAGKHTSSPVKNLRSPLKKREVPIIDTSEKVVSDVQSRSVEMTSIPESMDIDEVEPLKKDKTPSPPRTEKVVLSPKKKWVQSAKANEIANMENASPEKKSSPSKSEECHSPLELTPLQSPLKKKAVEAEKTGSASKILKLTPQQSPLKKGIDESETELSVKTSSEIEKKKSPCKDNKEAPLLQADKAKSVETDEDEDSDLEVDIENLDQDDNGGKSTKETAAISSMGKQPPVIDISSSSTSSSVIRETPEERKQSTEVEQDSILVLSNESKSDSSSIDVVRLSSKSSESSSSYENAQVMDEELREVERPSKRSPVKETEGSHKNKHTDEGSASPEKEVVDESDGLQVWNFIDTSSTLSDKEPLLEKSTRLSEQCSPEKSVRLSEEHSPEKSVENLENQSPEKSNELSEVETPEKSDKLSKVQSPEKSDEMLEVQSPEKSDKLLEVQSPEKSDGVSEVQSPEKSDELPEIQSPEKSDEISEVQSPEKSDELSEVQSPEKSNELSKENSARKMSKVLRTKKSLPKPLKRREECSPDKSPKKRKEGSSPDDSSKRAFRQQESPGKVSKHSEENISPEKTTTKFSSALGTPERQKKFGGLKYAGSRAAMLVACAKQNIKNRGSNEDSPSKSNGAETGNSRQGVSPSGSLASENASPSATPPTPSRKRKHCASDGGKPWAKHEPSPGATPSPGILKKSNLDDSFSRDTSSPPNKQRRVSFADPPVSDRVEIPPSPKTLRGVRAQKRLDMTKADSPPQVTSDDHEEQEESQVESSTPVNISCSQPIYPPLVTCDDMVDRVATHLTSPFLFETLKGVLEERGIHTVGNLAQLSEADVNQLPIRDPKIALTLQSLQRYEESKQKGKRKTDDMLEDVEAQLSEIFGEDDTRPIAKPTVSDLPDEQELPELGTKKTKVLHSGLEDFEEDMTIEEGITPLESSPEEVTCETINAFCKKLAENPSLLDVLAKNLNQDSRQKLLQKIIVEMPYDAVLDTFFDYLRKKESSVTDR